MAAQVIDVHTHMLSAGWLTLLKQHAGPHYTVAEIRGGQEAVHLDGAPFMTLTPGMFDYEARIAAMDEASVDVAVVSLTSPNVYWGGAEVSLEAAQVVNDDMAAAQGKWPDRIRWMASLPWEYPDLAVAELDRACAAGAVAVMVMANIAGRSLTDPGFAPVWAEIDRRGLAVLVHPTAPPATAQLDLVAYNLVASVGFMFDTTLAISRMIFDGFFDRYPAIKIIASHGGATLPYIAGRLDRCWEMMPPARVNLERPPQDYLRRIWYDAVVYRPEALDLLISVCGEDQVMYGSDYPHNIGDMVGCLSRVNDLPDGVRDKVRGTTASKLFGI